MVLAKKDLKIYLKIFQVFKNTGMKIIKAQDQDCRFVKKSFKIWEETLVFRVKLTQGQLLELN